MIEFFEINQNAIIALERVPEDKTHLYGIVEGEELRDGIFKIKNIVEKPGRKDAPSNLAIIGRYILPYQIFEILETIEPGKDGEVLFTDGLMELGRRNAVYGYELAGKRYDIGDKLGFLQATIAYALKDPQLEGKLRKFLKESLFL
jgi:UTP--glucose-1-phosphate uridylyltransferase